MNTTEQDGLGFQLPPDSILKLADYERAPQVTIDTRKEYMLLVYRPVYKSLDDLYEESVSMAGLRVNPHTNVSASMGYICNLKVRKVDECDEIQVTGLPENPRIAFVTWSPDEKKIAFTHTSANGLELWILNIENARAWRLCDASLNANPGNPLNWFRDSSKILIRCIPADRQPLIDQSKERAWGPAVTESDGSRSQNRTYADLLRNQTDEANFITLCSSELHSVDLEGNRSLFREKDLYVTENFSPDGNYLLITTLHKPFSYQVPLNRFPMSVVVYDLNAQPVCHANEVPLSEVLPKGFMAVRSGKRGMNWRLDQPSTLFYVEALDEGDPQIEVEYRDAVYLWDAPFVEQPKLMAKTKQRFSNVIWGNEQIAIVVDEWYDTRTENVYLVNPSLSEDNVKLVSSRNYQDIYADPGSFETWKNKYGKYTLAIVDNCLFRIGEGHTPEGQFPFIDQLCLDTFHTQRLYQAVASDCLEEIFDIEDFANGEALVRIQSATSYPNYYIRNFKEKNHLRQITFFSNPFESLSKVHKELIKYSREDGVELSGTLYLPAGFIDNPDKKKLPLLIWAYPAEYKDKHSAGQTSANPNDFTYPYYGSFIYWVTRGYAVLDDAAFPVVGEGDQEPNDTFIQQLIMNAKAAIDAVDTMGYIDTEKVAIGGHSYGAFMTAHLLTHSSLFACGIARSGAYNRTLTPFGFQTEQRNYWDAPELYHTMSPFMSADKMKTPVLLVHGEADNNPGTFTLQTERYFQALKGLGAPARLVILPKEQHSYMARENILHLLWEQDRFLEKYLK